MIEAVLCTLDFKNMESKQFRSTHQKFVKVLDVIWFEERQVARRLVIHLFHRPVFGLHVEASHSSHWSWCGS